MQLDLVPLLFRWLHILAAIAAAGGILFARVALLPSLGTIPDESRRALLEAIRARWSKVVMSAIAALLVSGFYNFGVIWSRHQLPGYYLPLFLVKVVLALVVFFIASALVGRSAKLAAMRQNARLWMAVNIVLAVIVVCIGGVLRMSR